MAKNVLDILGDENLDPTKPKPKKKKAYKPQKNYTYTEADLKLSGWNLEFDAEHKETLSEGEIYKLSQKQEEWAHLPRRSILRVGRAPSLYNKVSVFCPAYSIYGWGKNYEEAIKNCLRNVKEWVENHPELAKAALNNYNKKLATTKEKTVGAILEVEGL